MLNPAYLHPRIESHSIWFPIRPIGMWKAPELGPHVSWGRKGSSAVCRNEESVCRPPETLVKKCKDYLHNNVKQSSHPLRKSDFWSEFGPFGEMAPKWLRNSDQFWTFPIVIDYINTSRSGLSEKCPEVVRKWFEKCQKLSKMLNKIICMCPSVSENFQMCPKVVRKWSENVQNWCVRMCILGSVEALVILLSFEVLLGTGVGA